MSERKSSPLALAIFACLIVLFFSAVHIVPATPTIFAKKNLSFRYTFVSVDEVISEYNDLTLVDRMNPDPIFDHLIRRLQAKGIIATVEKEEE